MGTDVTVLFVKDKIAEYFFLVITLLMLVNALFLMASQLLNQ